MMNKKCCRPNNVNRCGNYYDTNILPEILQENVVKRPYLWRDFSTILVDFQSQEVPDFFEIGSLEKTIESIEREYKSEEPKFRKKGKYDPVLENSLNGKSTFSRIKGAFNEVISYTNLKLLYVNDNIIFASEDDINYNISSSLANPNPDIECVLKVHLHEKFYDADKTDPDERFYQVDGVVDNLGKMPGHDHNKLSIDRPKDPQPIVQKIYINTYNKNFIYFEDGNEIIFSIDETYFIPTVENINTFKVNVNKNIIDKYNKIDTSLYYYVIDFKLLLNQDLYGVDSYSCVFNKIINPRKRQNLQKPVRCGIRISDNAIRNSFGINPGTTYLFNDTNQISNNIRTLFFTNIHFTVSNLYVLMHEFCHILGMVHNFQVKDVINPYFRNNVYDIESEFNYLNFVVNNYGNIFDIESIMMYPRKKCILKKEFQTIEYINTRLNCKLSDNDKLILIGMYSPLPPLPLGQSIKKSIKDIFLDNLYFYIIMIAIAMIVIYMLCP